jgi:hypothetical protein
MKHDIKNIYMGTRYNANFKQKKKKKLPRW